MVNLAECTGLREHLIEDGFVVVPNVLDDNDLARWRGVSERLLEARGEKHAAVFKSQGSMIHTIADPEFADLVTHPATFAVLAAMGWTRPTHTDGYLISKPPGGARLFWHYDWFAWDDPSSHAPEPGQIFAMYYLQDTRPENGCLRVIPGSHRRQNPLHLLLDEPHSAALTAAEDMSAPEFSTRSDEIDVSVRAGDLVLGDARLLHAAHQNSTDQRRSLITIWYQPDFAVLPESVKASMTHRIHRPPEDYPAAARAKLEALWPVYTGAAAPHPRTVWRASAAPPTS